MLLWEGLKYLKIIILYEIEAQKKDLSKKIVSNSFGNNQKTTKTRIGRILNVINFEWRNTVMGSFRGCGKLDRDVWMSREIQIEFVEN